MKYISCDVSCFLLPSSISVFIELAVHAGIVFYTKHTFKDNGFCQNEAEFSCLQVCLDLDGLKRWKNSGKNCSGAVVVSCGSAEFSCTLRFPRWLLYIARTLSSDLTGWDELQRFLSEWCLSWRSGIMSRCHTDIELLIMGIMDNGKQVNVVCLRMRVRLSWLLSLWRWMLSEFWSALYRQETLLFQVQLWLTSSP